MFEDVLCPWCRALNRIVVPAIFRCHACKLRLNAFWTDENLQIEVLREEAI